MSFYGKSFIGTPSGISHDECEESDQNFYKFLKAAEIICWILFALCWISIFFILAVNL